MKKISRAIRPAGLIEGAATFSLYRDTSGIYCIKTGPATRELKEMNIRGLLQEILSKWIVKKVEARAAKEVEVGEAKIQENNLEESLKQKGSFFLPESSISDMSIDKNKFGYPLLRIVTKEKTHEFFFREKSEAEVREFMG